MEPEHRATSLRLASGHPVHLPEVRDRLFRALETQWHLLETDPQELGRRYLERLWSRGRWAAAELDGKSLMVRPMDVDGQGRLIVEMEEGTVLAVSLDRLRLQRE